MGIHSDVGRLLAKEVSALRAREGRRLFDSAVYVGTPGGARDSFVVRARDLPVIDRAVRIDVVAALVERVGGEPSSAWLVRPGAPEVLDGDVAWMTGAAAAFAMHGRALAGFWVITPHGWCEVRC